MKLTDFLNFSGKIAVVTGAAMGIGQAIAIRLAEAGAHVIVTDYNEPAAQETAASIYESGGNAEAQYMDVSNAETVKSVIERIGYEHKRIDILVNNAAIYPMQPFLSIDDELWRKTLEVNVMGVARCIRATVPQMVKAGSGTIINLASINSYHPQRNLVHYDTSKGGVIMMTKTLALELSASNIRVNAVAPGGIQTPGAMAAAQAAMSSIEDSGSRINKQAFMERIPIRRMGQPDDIARAVLFLASPMADYITGEVLIVDGGFLLS